MSKSRATKKAAVKKVAAKKKGAVTKKGFRAAASATQTKIVLTEDARGRSILKLRDRLGMNREIFARLLPTSVRNLASVESGKAPSPAMEKMLKELKRVVKALEEVVRADALGPWMIQPNDAFNGLKPIEVIERGEVDKIWEMIYRLRSGEGF